MFNKMAPEFLEIPSRTTKQGIDPIADFAEQIIPIHTVVVFGMPNHRFDGRAAFEQLAQTRCEIPPSRNVLGHSLGMIVLAPKAFVNKGFLRADAG